MVQSCRTPIANPCRLNTIRELLAKLGRSVRAPNLNIVGIKDALLPLLISRMQSHVEGTQSSDHFLAPGLTQPDNNPLATEVCEQGEKAAMLLVDDTPENLTAFASVLADLNEVVVTARSGTEALRCLLRQDFAVILLDVNMPDMNGFETASLIRQRKSSEHTPIIFVSAISTTETHAFKGYALGAVDYIFTPVVPEVLRSKVSVFLDLFKKTQEIKRQAARLRRMDQREHQKRLGEAAERLELQTQRNRFFTLSLEMLGIADFEGRLLQLNPSWERVLGYSAEELYQKSGLDLVHSDDLPAMRDQMRQLQQKDTTASFEGRYACKDGSYRWLGWTAASVVADRIIYIFARDITPRKLAEEQVQRLNVALTHRAAELEAANAELEREMTVRERAETALKESNAELEAFAYSVSHDLRAPLRAMQGFAQALLEDCSAELSSTGLDYAHRIISAATRLDTLIQDLLLYSRISHSTLDLGLVQTDVVLEEALANLEAPFHDSNANLQIIRPLLPVVAHHSTLVQVVGNLLSNAVKFVASGVRPEIRVRMESLGKVGRLWVEDNGIGIAPEFHNRIFRVFERLHGVEAYPGTGVGLAIVRKGIERMGGRVGVDSAPQTGSSFWIELPLALVEASARPAVVRAA
jgi:PAS domain S-box-containing protein